MSKQEYFVCSKQMGLISINSSKDLSLHKAFMQAFKIVLTRKYKKSLIDYALLEGFPLIRCAHCNRYILPNKIDYIIDDNKITIKDIGYINKNYFYCKNTDCEGKLLNPNSIEFVMKSYNLNKDDALKLIHQRNSTPFYAENHLDESAYKQYQTRDKNWYETNNKNIKDSVALGNYHKSLSYKIKMFGEELGKQIFTDTNHKKSMLSDDVLYERYSNDSKKILETKINFFIASSHGKISKSIFNSVDALVNYVYNTYLSEAIKISASKSLIVKQLKDKKLIHLACESLSLNFDDFINNYLIVYIKAQNEYNDNNVVFYKQTNRGYLYITKEGYLLHSAFEKDFYLAMVKHGLNNKAFDVNGLYPNQNGTKYRYDFYFSEIDIYIEIAGLIGIPQYNEKLKLKKQLFNPIVIYTRKDIEPTIKLISEYYQQRS